MTTSNPDERQNRQLPIYNHNQENLSTFLTTEVVYDLCVRGDTEIWTGQRKWIVGQMVRSFFGL